MTKIRRSRVKLCPFLVCGNQRASLTVPGEFTKIEYFNQCLMEECGAYIKATGYCVRIGNKMVEEYEVTE